MGQAVQTVRAYWSGTAISRIGMLIILATVCVHLFALWFIATYTTTFPLAIDEYLHVLPRASQALDGTLTWRELIGIRPDAPPAFFTFGWLIMLPNVLLFDWNLRVESFANYVLVAINTLLIFHLLTRDHPQLRRYLLLPITLISLNIQQRYNLLVGVHNPAHFQMLFSLLTFIALTPIKSLRWTLVFGFLNSLNSIIGWAIWAMILPAMWLLGYRNWRSYLAVIAVATLSVIIVVTLTGFGFRSEYYFETQTPSPESSGSLLTDIPQYALFGLAYLGGIFAHGYTSDLLPALALGLGGALLFLVNALYLWRTDQEFVIRCGLLAAYAVVYGAAAAAARLDYLGVRGGLTAHYITYAVPFVAALAALICLTLYRVLNSSPQSKELVIGNLLFALLAGLYFAIGTWGTLQDAQAHTAFVTEAERCLVESALSEERWPCLVVGGEATPAMIDDLYRHQLTGFAEVAVMD